MSLVSKFKKAYKWSFLKTLFGEFIVQSLRLIIIPIVGVINYGIFATVYIYFGFLDVVMGSGIRDFILSNSITDKDDLKMLNFIALFWSLIFFVVCISLSFLMPLFYESKDISNTLFILSFALPIMGIGLVPEAITVQKVDFKKIFFIELIPVLSFLFIALPLALKGYGLLALISRDFSNRLLSSLSYIYLNGIGFKLPNKVFLKKTKTFFKWISIERIIDYSSNTIDTFFISFLGPGVVGVYNLGKNLITVVFNVVNRPLYNIMLSIFGSLSKSYDNRFKVFDTIFQAVFSINISVAFLAAISSFFIFDWYLTSWDGLNIICIYLSLISIAKWSLWVLRDFLKSINKIYFYPIILGTSLIIFSVLCLIFNPLQVEDFLKIKIISESSYFIISIFLMFTLFKEKIVIRKLFNYFSYLSLLLVSNIFFFILSVSYLSESRLIIPFDNELKLIPFVSYLILILLINMIVSLNFIKNKYQDLKLYLSL